MLPKDGLRLPLPRRCIDTDIKERRLPVARRSRFSGAKEASRLLSQPIAPKARPSP